MFECGDDQAQGLRRLFARRTVQLVPVLSNPHAGGAARLLDGLCQAFAAQDLHVLVIDGMRPALRDAAGLAAALGAGRPLRPWTEAVDARTMLLPAGDALQAFAAGQRAAEPLFEALAQDEGAPDVILFHADAALLAGLFMQRLVRPLVLCGDSAPSLTHAYAGLKLLVQHAGLRHHAVLLDTAAPQRELPVAASRLQQCAAEFLRARVECAAIVCSNADGDARLARTLREVSLALLQFALPFALGEQHDARWPSPQPPSVPQSPFAR
ncbi:hypothetical protein [Caldimonas tepidiphila]|uniref:hypothetical protein n=1 Tax=Caldimonas tepidiphila TaxID=2315841 RepID=UPI000E5C0AD3|nr:hypothetical protein [Caldimonas tepidiphila]